MADVTLYGYMSPVGVFQSVWKGQGENFLSNDTGWNAYYLVGRPSDSITPSLTSATSKDDRISLTFDSNVNVGTPVLSKINPKDPNPTSVSQVSGTAIDIMWTLAIPSLLTVGAIISKITLDFDMPVNIGTPAADPWPGGGVPQFNGSWVQGAPNELILGWAIYDPVLSSITNHLTGQTLVFDRQVNATGTAVSSDPGSPVLSGIDPGFNLGATIKPQWTMPPSAPDLVSIQSTDTGLLANFNNPANAGVPAILPPQSPQDPALTGTTQVGPNTIKFDWTLFSGISLVSTTPSNGKVDLLFSVPIGVSVAGLTPGDYTVTSVTPGAYIPTVTNITFTGSTLTVHLDGQTIGATYVLHMPSGAVFNVGDATTWPGTSTSFTGADTKPFAVNAYPDGPYAFVVVFNEAVTLASATNPNNYLVVPGLTITFIEMIDDRTVRVHIAGAQSAGVVYTVTITGVIDRANNPT